MDEYELEDNILTFREDWVYGEGGSNNQPGHIIIRYKRN
jgi:hypothetical protein